MDGEYLPDGVTTRVVFVARDGSEHRNTIGAIHRNEDLARCDRANAILNEGGDLGRAVAAYQLGDNKPDPILSQATKDTKLVISHWQCAGTRIVCSSDECPCSRAFESATQDEQAIAAWNTRTPVAPPGSISPAECEARVAEAEREFRDA